MIIHRSHPARGYTIIPDATLRDPHLSYEARGVLVEILSRPDDWRTTAAEMAETARRQRGARGEGRRKLAAAFAELRAAGYMEQVRVQGPRGRMAMETHVYDTPQTGDTPSGMPVRPAETQKTAGGTGIPPGRYAGNSPPASQTAGMPVRPAETGISPGGTGIPLTGMPAGGTSYVVPRTESLDDVPLSPAPGSLHAALAAVVPGVTAREADLVREMIGRRPGIRSTAAVMRREITDGSGPALVAAVRAPAASTGTPGAPHLAGICGWCSRPGHDTAACPEAAEARAADSQGRRPAALVAGGMPGDGREAFTQVAGALRVRVAGHAPAAGDDPDGGRAA